MINYLQRVERIWSFILDDREHLKACVDACSVQFLETLVPAFSVEDYAQVRDQMASGVLFPLITDLDTRSQIQNQLERMDEPILSLATFFESAKLLELGMKPLRLLLPKARKASTSLRIRLERCLDPALEPNMIALQISEQTSELRQCRRAAFMTVALCQLFLYSVRHFAALNGIAPRKENGASQLHVIPPHETAASGLAELAHSIGFRSEEINRLRMQQPELKLAQDLLHTLRPDDEYECTPNDRLQLATTICRRLSQMARARISTSQPVYTHDVDPLAKHHRLGRPYDKSHHADRKYLFLDQVYSSRPMERRRSVTSLAMKRFTVIAFFGELNVEDVLGEVPVMRPPPDQRQPAVTDLEQVEPATEDPNYPELPHQSPPVAPESPGPRTETSSAVVNQVTGVGQVQAPETNAGISGNTILTRDEVQTRPDSMSSIFSDHSTGSVISVPMSQFVREQLQRRDASSIIFLIPLQRHYRSFLLSEVEEFRDYAGESANGGMCFWVIEGESRVSAKFFDELWDSAQENKIIIAIRKQSAETTDTVLFNGRSLPELVDYLDALPSANLAFTVREGNLIFVS
jgi:hypothetical protein